MATRTFPSQVSADGRRVGDGVDLLVHRAGVVHGGGGRTGRAAAHRALRLAQALVLGAEDEGAALHGHTGAELVDRRGDVEAAPAVAPTQAFEQVAVGVVREAGVGDAGDRAGDRAHRVRSAGAGLLPRNRNRGSTRLFGVGTELDRATNKLFSNDLIGKLNVNLPALSNICSNSVCPGQRKICELAK